MAEIILKEKREANIRKLFEVSVVLKGIGAALEVVLGSMLLFTNSVTDFVLDLAQTEFIEDPNDFISTHFHTFLSPTPAEQLYGGLYLLSHGVVKIVLVAGLLTNRLWAYPAAIAVLTLFILYQSVQWLHTHSPALIVLNVFDLLVLWLVYHEYRLMQKRNA